ncbi:G2/M phase-specific E3 ubiquitin-protein ligase-like [Sinocyclocheilus rhinocerous]|uniref:G2/M phase-specific E3 ubiquitin-protein ligase-like n=1 Tax=Sinocyclocheilus rhinocerous TaxID=307959 RepID=UPI0007B8006E|nr:PREDICTED: G2/M phase-specific E3 ubiquitin-protein ligase-like [Sinocyclocheilus rhinocerous]
MMQIHTKHRLQNPPCCGNPIKQILEELATKINSNQTCKFNINRASVLDGAVRGFTRLSYNPNNRMVIRFSDDKGKYEEAIDLGGPRREFLRLLLVALMQSSMFEGKEDSLNLALDSQAIRENRYFIAGRAVAVSLVHGGPAPGCFSKTLFDSLVQGPDMCIPVLDDVADCELYNKIKKVSEATTLEELQHSTEPIMDYLANAGCLRPLRSIADRDRLVEDLLMFQVVNRVRGPFERFRDGLKTLGVLAKVQQQPEAFRSVFCHQPNQLTADIMDDLFEIQWSENGSNKRANENRVIAFWRDYLQDVEGNLFNKHISLLISYRQ